MFSQSLSGRMNPCITSRTDRPSLRIITQRQTKIHVSIIQRHSHVVNPPQKRRMKFTTNASASAASSWSNSPQHTFTDTSSQNGDINNDNNIKNSSTYIPPASLPQTPRAATLNDVLPYLAKIALGEDQLYWRVAAALIALVASKAAGLFAPVYFKHAVDALSTTTTTAAAAAVSSSTAAITPTTAVTAAVAALALSGICRAASSLAKELQHPLFTPVSQAAGRRVSFYALAHVLNLDLHFHLDRNTGALARMLERGARSISMIFRAVVFTLAPTALELVAVCILLARSFELKVSMLVVATFLVYAAWTVGMTWSATKIRREVKDLDNAISGRAVDALLNVEAVKLAGAEQLEVYAYDKSLTSYQQASVRLEYASAMLNAGQAIILAGGMTAALIAAATGPGVTAGDMVMVQGLLLQLWAPLQFLGWFYRELRQSLVDMEDLFTLLLTPTSVPDGTEELPTLSFFSTGTMEKKEHVIHTHHETTTPKRRNPRVPGLHIQLNNVHFRYPGSERDVLKGVTITADPGESIAVVGPSGSGKSTLLRLLVRLFDVTEGSVVLDGCDIKTLRASSVRSSVAVVPQDTCLFNDTIENNVAYGQPGSNIEDVCDAAAAAKLTGAVERMPEGWGTVVGERGLKLSGGEKQRVAIARAFLRQPRLLICDEATSALDSETERGIMSSLQELATGRTSVFVAHRLSTIQGCDKIYVLKDGRVMEQGTHAELIAKGGVYSDMWAMQLAEEALNDSQIDSDGEILLVNGSGGGEVNVDGSSSEDEGVVVPNAEAVAINRTL